MPRYIDLPTWPRRAAFEHFAALNQPYFGLCARLDVAAAHRATRQAGVSLMLACHHQALRAAHAVEPFGYRLEEGPRVRVHERLHASTTVLRPDDSFGFCYLEYVEDCREFLRRARHAVDATRSGQTHFDPQPDEAAVIHFTTLPWVHFTSMSHPRQLGSGDSVPKLAFGRLQAEGEHLWMPLSVDVHHGLMDGLHVGRFVQLLEHALAHPEEWLQAG